MKKRAITNGGSFVLGLILFVCGLNFQAIADPMNNADLAWYRGLYVAPYVQVNTHPNPWDADAQALLEMCARRYAGIADAPTHEEIGVKAKSVIDAGCTEPLVYYVYYCQLRRAGPKAPDGELQGPDEMWLRKAFEGFRATKYPRRLAMKAALSVALFEKRKEKEHSGESRRLALAAVDFGIEAISNQEYMAKNGVPETNRLTSDLEYLRDMTEKVGFDTAKGFQRMVDRLGDGYFSNILDVIDTIASHERVPDHREWETLQRKGRRLLRTERFDELDQLATDLVTKKLRFQGGEWKSVYLYDGLKLPRKSPEEDWAKRFELIERWRTANPDSVPARLVQARTYMEYAWNARGGGYADSVAPAAWKFFSGRMAKAHDMLLLIPSANRQNPEWYRLMLMNLAETQQTDDYRECLQQAHELKLDYDWFDKQTAWYSLPRWYGNKGDWQKVAETAGDTTKDEDGDALYARVVWHIWDSTEGSNSDIRNKFFEKNNLSWPRMKQGFRDIEKRYPGSLWNLNAFCRFACMAKDKKAAHELFDRIDKNWDVAIWSNRLQYRAWRGWAETKDDDQLTSK
ncbi:MAG TPA: DUF4034 domain-containing protein [Verrucomicrobiae bacterium]|nr:DUF4034 domain-containing protein [Verrucomicrobiae bacterium]